MTTLIHVNTRSHAALPAKKFGRELALNLDNIPQIVAPASWIIFAEGEEKYCLRDCSPP
jgi:hypothetical protein